MGDIRGDVDIITVTGTPDVKRRAKPRSRPTNPNKMEGCGDSDVKNIGKIAKELAHDIVFSVSGMKSTKYRLSGTRLAKTMRRTVEEVSEKYEIKFRSMVQKLDTQAPLGENNVRATIDNIANKMMDDCVFNWGRLVTLYSFCACLAKHCVDNHVGNGTRIAETIAEHLGEYVEDHLCQKIQSHGGWEGFMLFFPEPHALESTMWKGLIYTVMGLGALATMVAAR